MNDSTQEKIRKRLKSSTRNHLEWTPEWDLVKSYTVSFIRKNKWKCDLILDNEDLLQEAYIIYMKICESYPNVKTPQHFMSLYKRALGNYIHDLYRYKLRKAEIHKEVSTDEMWEAITRRLIGYEHEGFLNALIAEAPEELKLILTAFENEEFLNDLKKPLRKRRKQKRKSYNQRICEYFDLDPKLDYLGQIKKLLQP